MTAPQDKTGDPRDDLLSQLPALRSFAVSLTKNRTAADDLIQETIEKPWAHVNKFSTGNNLRAWLFTILRNAYHSELRKRRREVADVDGFFAGSVSVKPDHDARLAYADFQRAFNQLSTQHREVLILVGASGFSAEEAARMMGVAVGTVKSRACRARKRLAELLGLAEGEDVLGNVDQATRGVLGRSAVRLA